MQILPRGKKPTDRDFEGSGVGYRTVNGERRYYARHGVTSHNDDYFTASLISTNGYDEIRKEYPEEIVADRASADRFREKYVDGHRVVLEGWNNLL